MDIAISCYIQHDQHPQLKPRPGRGACPFCWLCRWGWLPSSWGGGTGVGHLGPCTEGGILRTKTWDFTHQNLEVYAPKLGILGTKPWDFTRQDLGFYAPKVWILRTKTWDFTRQNLGFYAPKLGILRAKSFDFTHQNLEFYAPKLGILGTKPWDFTRQDLGFYAPKVWILRTKTWDFTRQNLGFYAPKLGILRAKSLDFTRQNLRFYAPKLGILRSSLIASWLPTRRFSEPTFRPSGATNHRKNTAFRDFPTFSPTWIFFLLRLSPLWYSFFFSSLLFSDFSHLCFSSVHIVGSLTSKLPSILYAIECYKRRKTFNIWAPSL